MHDPVGPVNISGDIERWQQNLLDLTRRNRLLFFKTGKSVVRIIETEPDPLIDKLSARKKGLSFPFAERKSRPENHTVWGPETEPPDDEPEVSIIPGDLSTDCAPLELQRRLRVLQQRDAEWDQEQGIKVLHLALGFLTWIDEDGYRGKAPILLLPATLRRRSPKDPYFLLRDSEDPEISPTLLYRLSQLGIDPPELGDMSVRRYLENFERAIRTRNEWCVDHDIFLSNFAYNKLAIWQDLEHLRENGVSHPLILEMSTQARREHTDSESGSAAPSAFPPADQLKGGKLDDLIGLRDQVTVINADFSQLEAIQSARRGQDLVIHGPPGTGKSQTITNIISALLSDGKKVLFVSEKRSALDVVKRNLERSDLGVFCLDLHSSFGRKTEVYKQLIDSLNTTDPKTRPMRSGRLEELKNHRSRLNQYVRAIHELRNPLGRSMFHMAGIYASVQNLPAVDCESLTWIPELDEARYIDITQSSDRIVGKDKEFRAHETSPWRPLRATTHYLGFGNEIARNLGKARDELLRLREAGTSASKVFGLSEPMSISESNYLCQLANHFVNAPGVLRSWLIPNRIDDYSIAAKNAKLQCRDLDELERKTIEAFGAIHTWPDFEDFHSKLCEIDRSEISSAVGVFLGSNWKEEIPVDVGKQISVIDDLHSLLSQLIDGINEAKTQTGDYPVVSWETLGNLLRVGEDIVNLCPVPETWITQGHQIVSEFERCRDQSKEIVNRKHKLNEVFTESFVGEVDQALEFRYRTNYQGILKVFRPQYWRDRRFIRGHMKVPHKMSVSESLNWIDEALEINRLVAQWDAQEESTRGLLGNRYNGINTDWCDSEKAFHTTLNLITNWPCERTVLSGLLTDVDQMHSLRLTIGRIGQNRDLIDAAWRSLEVDFPHNTPPLQMYAASATSVSVLKDLTAVTETILPLQQNETTKLDDLRSFVNTAIQFEQLEQEFEVKSSQLLVVFQQEFQGRETDWSVLENKLSWANKVIGYVGGDVPPALIGECEEPKSAEYYVEICESLNSDLTDLLTLHFVAAHSNWDAWDSAPFNELVGWIRYLLNNSDEVADWIEYRTICREIEDVFGPSIVSRIRTVTEESTLVPGILRRVLVEKWLNHVQMSDPVLNQFSASSHSAVWNQFRDLDRQLPGAIKEEVRRRCFGRYPVTGQRNPSSGQIGLLYRETNKKRRQLPVRQLLEKVPTLVHTFKPCFLMSPLAVSQFLPLKSETFDVVIFDEASQVFPEDAIPSIVRSNQCIVVGDRKQLPPTSFFRRTTSESDDEEEHGDDEDFLEGMESVLDVMVGLVGRARIAEQYLRVHYRSRHEHLIQFSNHWFYSERPLLVFPDPQASNASKALTAIHVPNGVYVPTQRTNHIEAERIVDVVFDLMEKHSDAESIGVVALSRAQSDYIQHRIDMRRMLVRHLDNCFDEELREPFFVKNLENVQGDERDHIVLGIGYGPLQEGGRTPNRFGALNLEGAGRRLNVAISRARKTMTVVHSVRDSDITSESEGARLLKSYLQYAANPNDYFEKETGSDFTGEPESPFEESVIAALREKGHNVDSQIGVAGYRVDIGVLSEERDRYILGIECDGYTYHSSPAARDRDWLRQSILEGLGWNIHRVWSTSWIQNPTGELENIEKAIHKARASSTSGFDGSRTQRTIPIGSDDSLSNEEVTQSDNELVENVSIASGNTNFESGYQTYKTADLADFEINSRVDLAETDISILRPMILETVRVEMPIRGDCIVRRIRGRWNLKRAGNRIRNRVVEALSSTVRFGQLNWDPSTMTGPILQRFVVFPGVNVIPRKPCIGEPPRSIDEISKSEILEGILDVEKVLHGGSRADLISQTAKGFGYDQVGSKISKRISLVLESLIRSGILRDENGVVLRDPTV